MLIGTTTIGIIMMTDITNRGATRASTSRVSGTHFAASLSWSRFYSGVNIGSSTLPAAVDS